MEGFSRLIMKARRDGRLKGEKNSSLHYITHSVFVNHVLLSRNGIVEEWKAFQEIIALLCEASGMEISPHKSSFICNRVDYEVVG